MHRTGSCTARRSCGHRDKGLRNWCAYSYHPFRKPTVVDQTYRHRRKHIYRRRCGPRRCLLALDDQCRRPQWRFVCRINYCSSGVRDTARGDTLHRPLVPPRKATLLHVSCDESIPTSLETYYHPVVHDCSPEQRALGFTDLLTRLAPEYRTWFLNDVGFHFCEHDFPRFDRLQAVFCEDP
jgi:hypothetical protein